MAANPIPDDPISFHNRQSAIIKTDTNRIKVVLALQFFELQAWMGGIALEQSISALRVALNLGWQI
jgi:hypothetical protein